MATMRLLARIGTGAIVFGGALLLCVPGAAQGFAQQYEISVDATARVFPEVTTGVTAIARDAAGRYYVLRGADPEVLVYSAEGTLERRVTLLPPPSDDPKKPLPALVYGTDLAVDAEGRLWVADRGGDAVRVFAPDGSLARRIDFPAPASLALLPDGELALAGLRSPKLVTVLDRQGRLVREFGELAEAAERAELNRYLNIGRLVAGPQHQLYYAFTYLPEPTVRQYDRMGYLGLQIELASLDIVPVAQAARREITRQERGGPVALKPVVRTIGVDPEAQEVWLGLGGLLMRFDAEGNRRSVYRTFTPEGGRVEAVVILVEPERLLVASETLGVFAFPRPDKLYRTPAN